MEEERNVAPTPEAPQFEDKPVLDTAVQIPKREKKPRKSFKEWWATHKPTKRRLIQVYAALLTNANIRGFASGRIYNGATKNLCAPGLNCYSCPGAVASCPLGALQNAFAQSGTRAPYYVLGIIMLYGLLLARTICGFLCPTGLGQELLYKIKTPKLKKNRVTHVLSYLKYVILVVFVIAIPFIYGLIGQTAIPAFCKYICPAGTFGGAVGLLMNRNNAGMYAMLGELFTWKFAVLVAVIVASVFIYRFFCRFLCPLGAIYGFFNKFAILGVKVDQNKCTDCGLCVSHCKMDIRKVGDHECINCGECISVCPAKAIRWKGSRFFIHDNAISAPVPAEKPLNSLLNGKVVMAGEVEAEATAKPLNVFVSLPAEAAITTAEQPDKTSETSVKSQTGAKRSFGKTFWLQVGAWSAALAVLVGALVYYNFIYEEPFIDASNSYILSVSSTNSSEQISFTIEEDGEGGSHGVVVPVSGEGTEEEPYVVEHLAGNYEVTAGDGGVVYYSFKATSPVTYTVTHADNVELSVFYYGTSGNRVSVFESEEGNSFKLYPIGNKVGQMSNDFTLENYTVEGETSLSDFRGKIVFVNFWATWCGPCVLELPEFQRIKEKYGDLVEVIAVHSAQITEDVQNFIDTKDDWKEWGVHFVQDRGNETFSEIFSMMGGKDSYPVTVMIDQNGVVRWFIEGSITYNVLDLQVQLLQRTQN